MRLTKIQLGIYLECMSNLDSTRYNISIIDRLSKNIDVQRLARAIDAAIKAHPGLSTRISVDQKGNPVQEWVEGHHSNIIEMSDEEFEKLRKKIVKKFDINNDVLSRFEIYVTPSGNYFYLDIHHIIFDGTSLPTFADDIAKAYNGIELIPEKYTIADEIEYEDNQSKERISAAKEFYDGFLSGVESYSLPQRDVYSDTPGRDEVIKEFHLDEKAFKKLRNECGITRTAFFSTAAGILFARMNGKDDSYITSTYHGRRQDNSMTVSMFVRAIPQFTNIVSNPSVKDIVSEIYKQQQGSYEHDAISFVDLANEYELNDDIQFAYQKGIRNLSLIKGYDNEPTMIFEDDWIPSSSIMIEVMDKNSSNGEYELHITYRTDVFSEGLAKSVCSMYIKIAQEMLIKEHVNDIELMDDESLKMIDEFNQTDIEQDLSVTPYQRVKKWMKETPDATCTVFGDARYTYADLDRLTAGIAAYIQDKGIGVDDFVSILIPRNEFISIASVGVIRSGAAYQPLDPSYPKERLNFMVKDSGAKLLIVDRSLRPILDEYNGDVLYTDEIRDLPVKDFDDTKADSNSAFTILYTSGTTGVPKGCILENGNLTSFLNHYTRNLYADNSMRNASYASYGFDANMMDLFTTLCNGGELHIIPEDMRLDLMKIDEYFIKNGITHSFMTTQVGRQFITMTKCKTLRLFMVGGEKLVPVKPTPGIDFINGYGPTESTAFITSFHIKDDYPLYPIGRPNDNTRAYVVDKHGHQVPVGVLGELYAAGPQVARGYLNRPEKTAESFIKNPFSNDPKYARTYRTGDIVRWLPDGNLECIGRNDGQVKVRGFRIELTEVEKVIRDYPGIKDATVAAFDAPSGGKFIAAYVVSDQQIDVNDLNKFIADRKPPYMVPAATVQIDKIPLNVNSKVDKRKLPKPEIVAEDLTPPENERQKKIFEIIKNLLGTESFGIDTDLHAIGLNSITTIRLTVMLFDEFGVDMQIKDLKDNATIRKLDELIGSKKPAKQYEVMEDYPLSKTQEGIFSECIANPGTTIYNIPMVLKISKDLDLDRLKEAIVKTIDAHSFVRTRLFLTKSGDVRLRKDDPEPFGVDDIPVVKIDSFEKAERGLIEPYNIIGDRLFRIKILESPDEIYLYMDFHHIVSDGSSYNILIDDISTAYAGKELDKEKFSGFEVILSEIDNRTEEALKQSKEYYEKLLGGCDSGILPKSDLYVKGTGLGRIVKDGCDAAPLMTYCDKIGATMNGAMCSIMGFVLSKFCGTNEPVFTTVYNGRDDSRTSHTVAMMVKTLPVMCNIAGKTSDYVKGISQQIMDSMTNSVMSFAEVSREFGVRPDILFIYQGSMFNFDRICGKPSNIMEIAMDQVKSPISLFVFEINGKLQYQFEYDKALFSEGFVNSFIDAFDTAIKGFIERDELADIDIVSKESRALLDKFNETDRDQELETSPYKMVEGWMKKTPESYSVCFKDVRKTYADLDRISAKICGYIQSKGIGVENFVAVLVPRCEWIVLATIGILRSGAAYQPLDYSYPKDRLNFMVKDSGAKLVIMDRSLRDNLDEYKGDILYTDEIEDLPLVEIKPVYCKPKDAFTILYTSGTTGVPKGCILENGNVKSTINYYTRSLEGNSKMRTACYNSYGFDVSMMDIFTALCNGGELHVIPEDMRLDLPEIDKYYIKNGITHGSMTTQVGRQFIAMTKCKSLKHFMVAGEKLVPVMPAPWVDLVNGYGPTEAAIYVTCAHVKDDNPLCHIGRPNDNTRAYVVDKNGHLMPMGAMGELYIAGPQVARGYLNRPEKTAESFIKNPFDKDPKYEHAYRTGDIVRWLSDGNLECFGRNDGQVKVRGFRIELTEVEKVIRDFPGIKDATVAAFDAASGGKFIAAYVVSDQKVDIDALNAYILESKPPYMVPAVTMQIDKIPLNVNRKVDKRKLPKPDPQASRKEGKMPKTDTEKKLCEIYKNILGLDNVFLDDDFFSIGGTSISASKLVLNCMNAGFSIVYKNIFDNPTPEKLARFIDTQNGTVVEEKEKRDVDKGPLSANVPDRLDEIKSHTPRRVLLTGATGYLGAHILFELLRRNARQIYCLVRSSKEQSAEERLKAIFMYYFGGMIDEKILKKVIVVDSDITDPDLNSKLKGCDFDTIINSAAIVKHFAADDSIERVNVGGVKNLIDVAIKANATLVQISTESVAGESVNGSVPEGRLLKENELDIGQDLENKYVHSKYMAEKMMIDSIPSGLKAKIMRVGNLMSRDSDGEFQINFQTNAFMKQMKSYVKLGFFPVTDMDVEVEFSPIDMVAKAVVILSGTPQQFNVFHIDNCHKVHMANVLKVMRDNDMPVEVVSKRAFNERFAEALKDDSKSEYVSGLISYLGNEGESRTFIGADESYTIKALYRLGFSWPIISEDYIDKAFKALKAMRFFK